MLFGKNESTAGKLLCHTQAKCAIHQCTFRSMEQTVFLASFTVPIVSQQLSPLTIHEALHNAQTHSPHPQNLPHCFKYFTHKALTHTQSTDSHTKTGQFFRVHCCCCPWLVLSTNKTICWPLTCLLLPGPGAHLLQHTSPPETNCQLTCCTYPPPSPFSAKRGKAMCNTCRKMMGGMAVAERSMDTFRSRRAVTGHHHIDISQFILTHRLEGMDQ